MRSVPWNTIAHLAREGLMEDVGPGDLTTEAVVPSGLRARAVVKAQQPIVVAGVEPAVLCFRLLEPGVRFPFVAGHGDAVAEGAEVLVVEGPARALLTAERTALNFLGRLSGIATFARRCVETVQGTGCEIFGTRKTAPGWRWLEKDALEAGGARPHRSGLYDAVLIKDNHLALGIGVARSVRLARAACRPGTTIEVEVETLEELDEALREGPDVILLDNMDPDRMREAVRRAAGRALLEASGGITLENLAAVAATGVHRISMGSLTHTAPSASLSLSLEPVTA
jgi:nicotinate-nucleotide pyrophosphorylase (carboxylating)